MRDPQQISTSTDDTTMEDEYEIARLDALPSELRDLAALHVLDQFAAVPLYAERFSEQSDS
jgi:hypothetical protein